MDHKKPPTAAQKALHKLGLFTSLDLALHLPYRYEDETVLTPLNKARDGQMVHIEVTVSHLEIQRARCGFSTPIPPWPSS